MIPEKAWYKSRTIWLNVVTLLTAVLLLVQGNDMVVDHPQVVAGIGMAVGILNLVLRFLSSTKVMAPRLGRKPET